MDLQHTLIHTKKIQILNLLPNTIIRETFSLKLKNS